MNNNNLIWIIGGIIVVIAAIAFIASQNTSNTLSVTPTPPLFAPTSSLPMTTTPLVTGMPSITGTSMSLDSELTLDEQNDSGQSGTFTLTERNNQVTVSIMITPGPTGVPQPAHIHAGSCPDVGAVKYPLTNVINGRSETTLNTSLSSLKSQLPLGLNVHKSQPESAVYIACGDLDI